MPRCRTQQSLENLTLTINQEIHVRAPLDVTFAALLEQSGAGDLRRQSLKRANL